MVAGWTGSKTVSSLGRGGRKLTCPPFLIWGQHSNWYQAFPDNGKETRSLYLSLTTGLSTTLSPPFTATWLSGSQDSSPYHCSDPVVVSTSRRTSCLLCGPKCSSWETSNSRNSMRGLQWENHRVGRTSCSHLFMEIYHEIQPHVLCLCQYRNIKFLYRLGPKNA